MAPEETNEDYEDEIPYEFSDPDGFYREWYGADTDEELSDAIESDDYDYD